MSDKIMVKILQKKVDQIANATDILVSKTRDWQVIREYISNRIKKTQLTENQQIKLERYQYIYNQLVSGRYGEQEVINQVCSFFKIELTQAYEDLNCAQEIFSTVLNINKRFEMKVELASARAMRRKCEEMLDSRGYAAIQKNIVALLKELHEEEANPGELFEGHNYETTFDPRLLGAPDVDMKEVLKAINEKRGKKIKIDMFEDIDHEEVAGNE